MTQTIAASAFLATEGVNLGGLYAYDLQGQEADLEYLGIMNARAGLQTPGQNGYDTIAQVGSLVSATGSKLDLVDEQIDSNGSLDPVAQLSNFASIEAVAPGAIRYIEGLNEINNQPISYGGYNNSSGGNELNAATAYQQTIYQQVTSDTALSGVGVLGFTGYDSYEANGDYIGGGNQVQGHIATVQNQHVYPPFNLPPASTQYSGTPYDNPDSQEVSPYLSANIVTTNTPIAYTEAGYTSTNTQNGGGEHLQAVYDLDLYLDGAKNGVSATYLYDINDGGPVGSAADDGYGLFYAADNTSNPNGAKPIATAIHNLNAELRAGVSGAAAGLTATAYSVAGEAAGSYDMELTQTNGDNAIVLWNEGTATLSETVSLAAPSNLSVYDPITGTTIVAESDVSSASVSLSSDPLILEVASAATAGPSVYVNLQTGNDSNSGSSAAPVADIQKALRDLESLGTPGTIYITGAQVIYAPVVLTAADSGDSIVGIGQQTPFLLPCGSDGVQLSRASGVKLVNFAIASPNGTGGNAVVVSGGSGNTLSGLTIFNMGGHDVLVKNSPSLTLVNDYFGDNGVTVQSSIAPMAQYSAPATSGLLAAPLQTYNWQPQTQLAGFLSAQQQGDASILFMGDSTTSGVGSNPSNAADTAGGYPEETAYWLNQDGVGAQASSVLGDNNNNADPQVSFANGGSYNAASGIDGKTMLLSGQGSSVTFTPDYPISANEIEAQVLGNTTDPLQIKVNGLTAGTITPGSNDLFNNDTLTLSQTQTITSVTITNEGTAGQYIDGIETKSAASNAIQVFNAGESGGAVQYDNFQESYGNFGANNSGQMPNVLSLDPSLVVLNYGLNDLLYDGATVSQTISFIAATIADLQSAGIDVILASPTPFQSSGTVQAAFVSALETLAVQDHVGLIDLNDTYGGNLGVLQAAGGISSNPGGVHPDATLYANIGQGIAKLISQAI